MHGAVPGTADKFATLLTFSCMNFSSLRYLLLAFGLALLLPAGFSQSQMMPAGDPIADMQAMQTANDDLLKRQEATLKDLTDMTTTANEIRIFSKRS